MIQDVDPGNGAIGLVQETEDLKLKVCHRGHLSDICKIEPPGGWRDARNSAPAEPGTSAIHHHRSAEGNPTPHF